MTATGGSGISDLAGIAAGWFFGANPAGVPVYDPATGVTNDGVQGDGTVNPNSGAESTIHGLLTHAGAGRTSGSGAAGHVRRRTSRSATG